MSLSSQKATDLRLHAAPLSWFSGFGALWAPSSRRNSGLLEDTQGWLWREQSQRRPIRAAALPVVPGGTGEAETSGRELSVVLAYVNAWIFKAKSSPPIIQYRGWSPGLWGWNWFSWAPTHARSESLRVAFQHPPESKSLSGQIWKFLFTFPFSARPFGFKDFNSFDASHPLTLPLPGIYSSSSSLPWPTSGPRWKSKRWRLRSHVLISSSLRIPKTSSWYWSFQGRLRQGLA